LIDWTLEKYKETATATNLKKKNQQSEEEAIIIDNIIEELDKKRELAINNKKKALLKDEVSIYRLEENTIDYILFIICELTSKLYYNKSDIIFPSFTLYYLYPYREFFLWYHLIEII
jgi:hypothetical protein